MKFSILLSFLLLLITLCYYVFLTFFNRKKHQNLPPGSSGWPFFGETLDYLRIAKNGVPEKFISDRRKKYSSDVFRTSLLGESMVLLCSAEGNKFMFSKEDQLVKSWWPKNVEKVFDLKKSSIPEDAIRIKKFLRPLLKPDSLRRYVGIIDASMKKHLNTYWDGEGVVKVHTLARKYAFGIVCKLFLSLETPEIIEKLEESVHNITSGISALPVNFPGTKFNRAIKSSRQVKKEIEKIVAQRRADVLAKKGTPVTDLLSEFLVQTDENGELFFKISDIAKYLDGLVVAAYDSVSVTMVSIMSYLAELPEVYDGVFREQMEIAKSKSPGELLNWEDIKKMKYSWNVGCEVLRLLPPSPGTFREAISDFKYEGFLIPKGIKLHWNAYATHKNPKYFPEPKKFDPSRFEGNGPIPYSYVPFGGGPRMCPGNEYARLKILVFMHNVVTKFKWEKVFPDEKIIMDPMLAPQKGFPIRLYPYVGHY